MNDAGSPSEPESSESRSPEEVFGLLSNETRIGILQALWDAFEFGTRDNGVTYTELFDQVAIDDSGNFSYHLEKLTGPFVHQIDEGYELKQTGINVVRAIIEGTVTEDPAFGPTRVGIACPLCDAPIEVTYADEVIDISCTACEGRIEWRGESGHLFGALVPPIAIERRTVEEAFRAAVTYTLHRVASFHDGVCADCSGPVETSVTVCADHAPDTGIRCPNCDRTNMAEVWWACSTCKLSLPPPVTLVVLDDPRVTAFYTDHSIEHRFATWETVARSYEVDEDLVSEDPLRLQVTIPASDDELALTLDDELNVVDVSP